MEPQPHDGHITANDAPSETPGVSVVVPAYNEAETIDGMYRQLTAVMTAEGESFEILFIDDGSTDATWERISALSAEDARVLGIRHRRNFGKATALANGFDYARGEIVVITDADMQYDPADIPRLIEKVRGGWDVVSAYKVLRRDPLSKRLASKVFNFFVRTATSVPLHDMNAGLKAFRSDAAKALIPYCYGELHRFFVVFAARNGYSVTEVEVESCYRTTGKSKYGIERYLRGGLDFLTVLFLSGYSEAPLHVLGTTGLALGVVGTLIFAATWIGSAIADTPLVDSPFTVMSMLMIFTGVQLFVAGLLAEMINSLDRTTTGHHRIAEVRRIERRALNRDGVDIHNERRHPPEEK